MSKADKMFEELGYKKTTDGNHDIAFYKYEKLFVENDTLILIRFYAKGKEVWKNTIMTMEELKAINIKCRELKWI